MRVLIFFLLAVLAGDTAGALEPDGPARPDFETGSLVSLQVTIDGHAMPLYAAADGRRYYVEARKGAEYQLRLTSQSGERVGVELTVDGLNVISGERDRPGPDRMYVLSPWDNAPIRGWRASLDEVRTFTFVDEKVSYAARSGKANGKMGWIEMTVYRERHRPRAYEERESRKERDGARDDAPQAAGRAAPVPAPESAYPGTGWGDPVQDRVRLVDFEPERSPAQQMVVRYEYRAALVALGVLSRHHGRLEQRERGEGGFAKPPRW